MSKRNHSLLQFKGKGLYDDSTDRQDKNHSEILEDYKG